MKFINTGLDDRIVNNFLLKSMSHEGQIYGYVDVHTNKGIYRRHQWLNPNAPIEDNIHQGFRHAKSWEKRARDTNLKKLEIKQQIGRIKKSIEQTHSSIHTTNKKIKQLKNKIVSLQNSVKTCKTPKELKELTTHIHMLQDNLSKKEQELKELESQKVELKEIKDKTVEIYLSTSAQHNNAQQWHKTTTTDLQNYVNQYQQDVAVTQRDLGNFTDRPMKTQQLQEEYNAFRQECNNRFKVSIDSNGNKSGFRTSIGQLITSVDAQHLFKRSKNRGFSLNDIEYILQHPIYVTNGTDPTTGARAIQYTTFTRSIVVLQGGTIKTCMNIPVAPPKSFARWITRGWNYKNDDLKTFKRQWYQNHPGWEEKDRKQDEKFISDWAARGFDLTRFARKDRNGNIIRDEHGHMTYTNETTATYLFSKFIEQYAKIHKHFNLDGDMQAHFPDEFVFEQERQQKYTGDDNSNEYKPAYRRRSAIPPANPTLQHWRAYLQSLLAESA